MTLHPALFPTLLLAAATAAASAALRRTVRKEYASFLPWMWPWGAICAVPALLYAGLCLPGFGEMAAQLNESMRGTWAELLAGGAGALPGLLWDGISERMEQGRRLPFGLTAAALRAVLIAATLTLILIPYGWGFDRTAPSTQATPEQTEADSAPTASPTDAPSPAQSEP